MYIFELLVKLLIGINEPKKLVVEVYAFRVKHNKFHLNMFAEKRAKQKPLFFIGTICLVRKHYTLLLLYVVNW